MALMKTSNPALGQNTFRDLSGSQYGTTIDATERMTLSGTVNKTGILLLCAFVTAAWTWRSFVLAGDFGAVGGLLAVGGIGGFICALVTVFKKQWSPVTAPLYALLEGLVLGGIGVSGANQEIDAEVAEAALEALGLTP